MTSQEIKAAILYHDSAGSSESERWLREIAYQLAVKNEREDVPKLKNNPFSESKEFPPILAVIPEIKDKSLGSTTHEGDGIQERGSDPLKQVERWSYVELFEAAKSYMANRTIENPPDAYRGRIMYTAISEKHDRLKAAIAAIEELRESERTTPFHAFQKLKGSVICAVCGAVETHSIHSQEPSEEKKDKSLAATDPSEREAEGSAATVPGIDRGKVRIYSGEHGAYWREDGRGYTTDRSEAGVWWTSDALAATAHCGPEQKICLESVPTGRMLSHHPSQGSSPSEPPPDARSQTKKESRP